MYLYSYNSEPYIRLENDLSVIENLLRKGWLECPPIPNYDPLTHNSPKWKNGWVLEELSEEQKNAITRKVWKNVQGFIAEFSDTELYYIANSTDPNVVFVRFKLQSWNSEIWSDNEEVIGGLNLLESVGILSKERKDTILSKV